MRVLLTGASGFMGRHFAAQLSAAGHELLLLSRQGEQKSLPHATTLNGDLSNLTAWQQPILDFAPEACVHAAWQGIPDLSRQPSLLNHQHSINLLDFLFQQTSCRRVLGLGSCLEYGSSKGPCAEDSYTPPISFFTWAKQSICQHGLLQAQETDRDFLWLRLFYVCGRGQRPAALLPSLIQAVQRGETPSLKEPQRAHDYCDVEDCARAICLALQSRNPLRTIINLGRGQALRNEEILQQILALHSGQTPKPFQPVTREEAMWADGTRAEQLLGWKPEIDMSTTIQGMMQKYSPDS